MIFFILKKTISTHQRSPVTRRCACLSVLLVFVVNSILGPVNSAWGQSALPLPVSMVNLSPSYEPALIKGIRVYPDNPLRLDFIVDPGQSGLQGKEFSEESTKLMKYFLSSLTVPDKDMWVNLSPYEKDRIIPDAFGETEMGRDMLAQDYILKQLTSSVIYPESELGQSFWTAFYQKLEETFGSKQGAVNTFNKIWIVPQKAVVYTKDNVAYVVESHLKVMLEEDYLALENSSVFANSEGESAVSRKVPSNDTNKLGSQLVREMVLPAIEKEVNEGENFAPLRQVYHSLILATWFKRHLKKSLLSKIYVGQNKIEGMTFNGLTGKDKIYANYLEAFKKGVYNFIREEEDTATGEMIPRKYFSGGVSAFEINGPNVYQEINDLDGVIPKAGSSATLLAINLARSSAAAEKGEAGASSSVIPFSVRDSFIFGPETLVLNFPKIRFVNGVLGSFIELAVLQNPEDEKLTEAIKQFRTAFDNKEGDSLSSLRALKPLVKFIHESHPEENRFQNYLKNEGSDSFLSVSEEQRPDLLAGTLKTIRELPDEEISRIFNNVMREINEFLGFFKDRINDWSNVEIDVVLNAADSFTFKQSGEGRFKLTINLSDFLPEKVGVERIPATTTLAWRYYLSDESHSERLRQAIELKGKVFLNNNREVVIEALRILDIMYRFAGGYYFSPDPHDLELSTYLRDVYIELLNKDERYKRLALLISKLGAFDQYSQTERGGQRLADTPGRIRAIFDFIQSDPLLAKRANLQGQYDEKDIQAIVELSENVDLYQIPVKVSDTENAESAMLNNQQPLRVNREMPPLSPPTSFSERTDFHLIRLRYWAVTGVAALFLLGTPQPIGAEIPKIKEAISQGIEFPEGIKLFPLKGSQEFPGVLDPIGSGVFESLREPSSTDAKSLGQLKTSTASKTVGGINLNTSGLMIDEQGEKFNFDEPIDPQILQNFELQPVNGLVPVILNVVPVGNLLQFLGLDKSLSPDTPLAFAKP